MNDIIELKDDLLVEEGHYLERIQSEALDEGWTIHTIREFESIIEEYGIDYVVSCLNPRAKETLYKSLVQRC